MPPLPPVPQVILVQWVWTYGSDTDVMSREHFKYTGTAPGGGGLAAWAQTISNFYAGVAGLFHPTVILSNVICTDLTSPTAGQGSHAATHVGTRTGGELPASTAVLINHSIGRRYRGGKARQYLPMGADSDLATPQTWAAASVTAFEDWFNYIGQIKTGAPAGTSITGECQVSYYKGSTANVTGTPPYERGHTHATVQTEPPYPLVDLFTGSVINPTVASQRRRERPG
jgi:hypothetical protein